MCKENDGRSKRGNELPIVSFKLVLEHSAQENRYAYFDGPESKAVEAEAISV